MQPLMPSRLWARTWESSPEDHPTSSEATKQLQVVRDQSSLLEGSPMMWCAAHALCTVASLIHTLVCF